MAERRVRGYSEEIAQAVRRDHAAGLTRDKIRAKYSLGRLTVERMIFRRDAYAEAEDGEANSED